MAADDPQVSPPSLREIAREWGRIGCVGFGGPPAHIALLRELCVTRRRWLTGLQFQRAIAATNLLPGPASTQLAIYCAWRLRGNRGALLGGLGFVLPGLLLILALSVAFLSGSPPTWLRAAGMGAGAAVPAVAILAGLGIASPLYGALIGDGRLRAVAYGLAGALAAALSGPWLVLVLLACGLLELLGRRLAQAAAGVQAGWILAAALAPGGTLALAWTALKVGALAFGGGFVIVPLMQSDAVGTYHWMSHAQFLNAVALGQITPGPVTHTVAAVGYAAGGLAGGLLAALVAFAPSFSFIVLGAARFERLLVDRRVIAFLGGAAPCAAGAIIGSALPLALALSEAWQGVLLAAAATALFVLRRGVVLTLLVAGICGALLGLLGAPVPR
jgi:chromate transporter